MKSKSHTMFAIPYNRIDLRGPLDVEKSGAFALFSCNDLALDYMVDSIGICKPIKVRVTIEQSGKRKKAK